MCSSMSFNVDHSETFYERSFYKKTKGNQNRKETYSAHKVYSNFLLFVDKKLSHVVGLLCHSN